MYNCFVLGKLQPFKAYIVPVTFGLTFLAIAVYILFSFFSKKPVSNSAKLPEVVLSTIGPNGELVADATISAQTDRTKLSAPRIVVNSANLVAIYDKNQMTGIRILGELSNIGGGFVNKIDPVVRFYNQKGTLIAQKIAQLTEGFDFKEVAPDSKLPYDVTVLQPPTSDRLEIVFNTVSSTNSADLLTLKIASRSMEIKTATVSDNESASASGSRQVEYYTVSGKVVNTFSELVSDIVVYAWAKDSAGKVFSFGRADFKNDLLNPSDKVDFKIILLPIKSDEKLDFYEIAAWGKAYKLLTSPTN